jgi:hypothetical protein
MQDEPRLQLRSMNGSPASLTEVRQ